MDAATGHGYKIEVIDDMRRAILPVKDWTTCRKLLRRLRDIRPDVVHTHSSKAGILGRWAARRAKVPVIVHTIHGLAFTAGTSRTVNGFFKFMEKRAAPWTDKIVCVADAMRRQSLAAGIGRAEQYAVIFSGMETQPFIHPPVGRQEVRQRLGLEDRHIVVGTIARLFHLKGHDDLLALAPDLCRKISDLRFLWIGDGILRLDFERRINALGLRERFILTGLVPPARVPELTGAMDILAHPSRREGLARALPQAALAGKPVVTYDIDGNSEGLIDGQTGFLLPPFDRAMLGEKIALLAGNANLRAQMGERGRTFALARFDAQVMVNALEQLYAGLLSH
jgi:glycosyltransferase involved in cell wall biosynthesis